MESFHISRLASEILLFIFLHLDLHQLVLCRRVNKEFQEVIDNYRFLWTIFEWIQQDRKSFRPALNFFDEKSYHSLEKVSIQEENSNEDDLLHLMQVLKKSNRTLIDVNLKVSQASGIREVVELLSTASRLRSSIVWEWGSELNRNRFPLSRLVPSNKTQSSSYDQLQLLWVYDGVEKVDSKHLESLISFAQAGTIRPQDCRKLISNFSKTVVHLKLKIDIQDPPFQALSCPNLKVFEGWVVNGIPSFFDAPQLKTIVMEQVDKPDLELLPSVEEIWLRSRNLDSLALVGNWEPLLRLCPKLRILKLTEEFVSETLHFPSFDFTGILEMLQARKQMVQDGKEINGIKIASFEKLILPTEMLNEEQLNRAAEIAEEVIDIEDHPEFIEIEY